MDGLLVLGQDETVLYANAFGKLLFAQMGHPLPHMQASVHPSVIFRHIPNPWSSAPLSSSSAPLSAPSASGSSASGPSAAAPPPSEGSMPYVSHPVPRSIWHLCQMVLDQVDDPMSPPLIVEDDIAFPHVGTVRVRCQPLSLDLPQSCSSSSHPGGDRLTPPSSACVLVTMQHVTVVQAREASNQFRQYRLTTQEANVWRLHQQGRSHHDIATGLALLPTAVQRHLQTILIKHQTWAMPQPGDIWEVEPGVDHNQFLPHEMPRDIFSDPALAFIDRKTGPRYVMIAGTIQSDRSHPADQPWVAVMVLTAAVDAVSQVDITIPAQVSGLPHDVLAETWHVVPMLVSQLLCPQGRRLSQALYETLMTLGDRHHSLTPPPAVAQPLQDDISLGDDLLDNNPLDDHSLDHDPLDSDPDRLTIPPHSPSCPLMHRGTRSPHHPDIVAFHHTEQQWSDVLRIPVTTHHLYRNMCDTTEAAMDEALWLDQLLHDLEDEDDTWF